VHDDRRFEIVESARFMKVVETAGEPEAHLVLTDPRKDRTLQAAIKTNRVMTVFQENAGSKADHGVIGFEPGTARQYLIFPKSLRAFEGKKIVGIKYDLLDFREVPLAKRANPPRPRPHSKSRPPQAPKSPKPSKKVVPFKTEEDSESDDEAVIEIKEKIRQAMNILEQGKPVAAFNLLKRIVDE
jgi:hypothetical protein